MGMFDALRGAGRVLLDLNGDTIEYVSAAAGASFVQGVIDESPDLQDPGKAGGQKFQAGVTMGYVHQDDIPDPKHDDLIKYQDRTWKVQDPKDGGGGLWEFRMREQFDE